LGNGSLISLTEVFYLSTSSYETLFDMDKGGSVLPKILTITYVFPFTAQVGSIKNEPEKEVWLKMFG
jgi:hypothetical protein